MTTLSDRCATAIEAAIAPLVGRPLATKEAIVLAIREAWDLVSDHDPYIELQMWEQEMDRILPLRFPELYGEGRGK
jgi:hypothetical protein